MGINKGKEMKYEIEIEGLPKGWKPVRYDIPKINEFILYDDSIADIAKDITVPCLIIEKIKPRKIVLEETTELRIPNPGEWYCTSNGSIARCNGIKYSPSVIWREVKEEETK